MILQLLLKIQGFTSCLPVCLPFTDEIETCEWIELTLSQEWNPCSDELADCETSHIFHHTSGIP
jgi:hypothetical protein